MSVDQQPDTAPIEGTIEPKREVPDGHVVVRLATALGEGDIVVPPRGKWRSMARNRLTSGDDLGWAILTLSREDAETWMDLDPDQDEAAAFFGRLDEIAPTLNRAQRRAQRNGHQ